MSLYTRGEPVNTHQYRDVTNSRSGQLENVQQIPRLALCICCGKRRTAATGKQTKRGFICGMCK